MVEFHFYYPHKFCMQNSAENGAEDVYGIRWKGSDKEKKQIRYLLDEAVRWSKRQGNLRLYNGEFGAHKTHPYTDDRLAWISFVRSECEARDIPWCYRDFGCNVRYIFDVETELWDIPVLKALGVEGTATKIVE